LIVKPNKGPRKTLALKGGAVDWSTDSTKKTTFILETSLQLPVLGYFWAVKVKGRPMDVLRDVPETSLACHLLEKNILDK
jgi:hypothetical protein